MTSAESELESELLEVAGAAADAAAAELMARFGQVVDVATKSTDTDPVSEADVAAETAVRAVLAARRPGDAILGEEGGETPAGEGAGEGVQGEGVQATGLRWVVDPLDGTVNYLYGIPQFAVSVGVEDASGGLAGVVVSPVSGERFWATRSGLAWGSAPGSSEPGELAPRGETRLSHALVATGFGYDAGVRAAQGALVAALLPRVRDIRRAGAAALDLCAVAAGRVDAYFERGVKPWDISAGSLICERVGLEVRRLEAVAAESGGSEVPLPEGILVAPAAFVDELMELVVGG